MASIYKRQHRRPNGTKSRSRCWYYAFTGPDGLRVTRRGFTDKEATKARAAKEEKAAERMAAGLKTDGPNGHLTFHSPRYFFCTELAKVLPIQRVRQLMRHRQIQTTMDLYCQLGLDDLFDEYPTLPSILKR